MTAIVMTAPVVITINSCHNFCNKHCFTDIQRLIHFINIVIMTELINKLVERAGVSTDQAVKSLDVIKDFVKEKFPMLAGAVDNIFGAQVDAVAATVAAEEKKEASWMDKISDVIPGSIGEKVESFTKSAADKAEDAYEAVKDKASDLYEKGKDKFDDLRKKD